MAEPLVSVVIPTYGRQHFLLRAISSALEGMASGAIEVIVVPNGPDSQWNEELRRYEGNPSVVISPIRQAGANAARNHGLSIARGRYVRFLDDDDVLYPEGAMRQYAAMEASDADVCSGSFDALTHVGDVFQTVQQLETDDLFCAFFAKHGMWQPTAHVYRREAVQKIRWDERLPYAQDFDWLLAILLAGEQRWLRCDWTVGAWHRHLEPRISLAVGYEPRRKILAERTLKAILQFEAEGRMTPLRRQAVATLLWNSVHASLCHSPFYWTRIALIARNIAPGSYPDIPFYTSARGWRPHPLFWEWVMFPKRRITRWFRAWASKWGRSRHG